MRLAVPVRVRHITAFDISISGEKTYKHNFCVRDESEVYVRKLIEQIPVAQLDGKADLWTMSPPCQPFSTTKAALQKGLADPRCKVSDF
jgi:tRNA (cytosine38-C5)-methyltransferase